jgi:hypothetical protein
MATNRYTVDPNQGPYQNQPPKKEVRFIDPNGGNGKTLTDHINERRELLRANLASTSATASEDLINKGRLAELKVLETILAAPKNLG